jgi:hypothetical protein
MIKYIVFIVLILSTSIGFCKEEDRKSVFIKFLSSSQEVAIKVNELKIIGESLEKKIISDFDTKKLYVMSKSEMIFFSKLSPIIFNSLTLIATS